MLPKIAFGNGFITEKKNWIAGAAEKAKEHPGKCTGQNFGSDKCPKGSPAYNLAKVFKKAAKKQKKD